MAGLFEGILIVSLELEQKLAAPLRTARLAIGDDRPSVRPVSALGDDGVAIRREFPQ
jgi:hypothetical protein